MADCLLWVKLNYKKVYENYLNIDDTGECIIKDKEIIYKDMIFLDKGDWCLIITVPGETYAEEILIQISAGNRLIYFYTDEDQLDVEFIVIENNTILRRFLYYKDSPELNANDGKLKCETNISLCYWNDIDQFMELADGSGDSFFD